MTTTEKKQQLRNHKLLATGLFILMALIFIAMTIGIEKSPQKWMYYVRAFSEAAMVGALADWFAVTALFHYPLGLRIPHTNLIENSKQRIGDNLGSFVVDNFLTSENLRPYISKLEISKFVSDWLEKEKNKQLLSGEVIRYAHKIILELDDQFIIGVIDKKGKEFLDQLNANELLGQGLEYAMKKDMHNQLMTFLAGKLKTYIAEHEEMVKEKVKEESSVLIPGFVDNMIAKKITNGLTKYFGDIENNAQHPVRADIAHQLKSIATDIKTKPEWKQDIDKLKNEFLDSSQTAKLAEDIWKSVKNGLVTALEADQSALKNYIYKSIDDIAATFKNDADFNQKINAWIRKNAYKVVLKNRGSLGALISQTVGNWEGKDLSEKLELEVGKDLQFIRINGTLVGGIVGLIIYTITQILL